MSADSIEKNAPVSCGFWPSQTINFVPVVILVVVFTDYGSCVIES